MFKVDDKVTTPRGVGYVSYVEDGYMEVEVAGNEMSFEAPFAGVELWVDPEVFEAEMQAERESECRLVLMLLSEGEKALGKAQWAGATLLVRALGGSGADWDDLSAFQKLNFVAVSQGIPTQILMEKTLKKVEETC